VLAQNAACNACSCQLQYAAQAHCCSVSCLWELHVSTVVRFCRCRSLCLLNGALPTRTRDDTCCGLQVMVYSTVTARAAPVCMLVVCTVLTVICVLHLRGFMCRSQVATEAARMLCTQLQLMCACVDITHSATDIACLAGGS
jgi:hypothetical protein